MGLLPLLYHHYHYHYYHYHYHHTTTTTDSREIDRERVGERACVRRECDEQ